jgi:hypothetical protein
MGLDIVHVAQDLQQADAVDHAGRARVSDDDASRVWSIFCLVHSRKVTAAVWVADLEEPCAP